MNLFKNNSGCACNTASTNATNNGNILLGQIGSYKQIAEKFLELYYVTYDSNFQNVANLYASNPCITFADEEFLRFSDLSRKITHDYKIFLFQHKNITFNAQPINERTLIINVTGELYVNAFDGGKFNETIVLTRDDTNRYYVTNTIFKVI